MEQKQDPAFSKLTTSITRDIDKMEKDANYYRKSHKGMFIGSAVLSALITIFSGWGYEGTIFWEVKLNHLILISGASISFLNILMGFNAHNKLWVSNTISAHRLKELLIKIELSTVEVEKNKQETYNSYKNEYLKITREYNQNWEEARRDNIKPKKEKR